MGKYKIYLNTDSRSYDSSEKDGGYVSVPSHGDSNNTGIYIKKVNDQNIGTIINVQNLGAFTQNLDIKNIDQKLSAGMQSAYNSINNDPQYNGSKRFSYISGSNLNNGETIFGRFVY